MADLKITKMTVDGTIPVESGTITLSSKLPSAHYFACVEEGSVLALIPKKGQVARLARWLYLRWRHDWLKRRGFENHPVDKFIGVGVSEKVIHLKWDASSGEISIRDK